MVAFGSLEIPPGTVSVLLSLESGGRGREPWLQANPSAVSHSSRRGQQLTLIRHTRSCT